MNTENVDIALKPRRSPYRETNTGANYSNPRCACEPRVNYGQADANTMKSTEVLNPPRNYIAVAVFTQAPNIVGVVLSGAHCI